MKLGIGTLGIGALFCIALFCGGDRAEAGLPPDLPTERTTSGLFDLAGTVVTLLDQTVRTTVEAPSNLVNGVTELLTVDEALLSAEGVATRLDIVANTLDGTLSPVTEAVGTVVGGTSDIAEQVVDLAETTIEDVTRSLPLPELPVLPVPPPPLPPTPAPTLPQPSPPLPTTPSQPASEPATEPTPSPQAEQTASEQPQERALEPDSPAAGLLVAESDNKPVIPTGTLADSAPAKAPFAKQVRKKCDAIANDDASPKHARKSLRTTRDEQAPRASDVILEVASPAAPNPQPPAAGHSGGATYAKHSDAIVAESAAIRLIGRKTYAKNTRQLISKRGNEPPTPPPRHPFSHT
ncbi:hypothetical protein [Cohnella sp. GCM10027633]|uniref:hypothetical protein n=1 Tax=unclassified Cohnella TaxID=2636738 RepID=UPI00362B47AB